MTLKEVMVLTAILGITGVGITSCANCSNDNTEAVRALETNGFTNVIIQDSGIWGGFNGCDGKDMTWYDASATNPIGKPVNVVVCCGGPLSFKGCTVRSK